MAYKTAQAVLNLLKAIIADYPGAREELKPVIHKIETGRALEPEDVESIDKWLAWVAVNSPV